MHCLSRGPPPPLRLLRTAHHGFPCNWSTKQANPARFGYENIESGSRRRVMKRPCKRGLKQLYPAARPPRGPNESLNNTGK